MRDVAERIREKGGARAAGEDALRRYEWLLTSGHGAYAMGTAAGSSTRRYHGLLVGTLRPPVERVVALSCVRDRVSTISEKSRPQSTHNTKHKNTKKKHRE